MYTVQLSGKNGQIYTVELCWSSTGQIYTVELYLSSTGQND